MKWHISEIIDLEYFLHKDGTALSGGKQQDIHERDRTIFLESVVPEIQDDTEPDRQRMIKTWLRRRREAEKSENSILPGEGIESLYSLFRFVFLVSGLVFGAGLGGSFPANGGDQPVNVFAYLAVFVAIQLLLLLILSVLSAYRLSTRSFLSSSPLYLLISRLILRMLLSARSRMVRKLSAEKRLHLESILGTLLGKSRTYGYLFLLPVFMLTQLFAIGFNLGLLGATLFKVTTADIAFGWQSTINLSAEAVHSLVEKMAMPWSWFAQGDTAYPTLAQIEGSHIVLKEGIYHLATPDLVSWWPFLCFAVLVYGLLPRLLLFLAAVAVQMKMIGSLDFKQGMYEQLVQRMTTPRVTTRGRQVDNGRGEDNESNVSPEKIQHAAEGRVGTENMLVMIPDDIYDSCSREELESVLNTGSAYVLRDVIRINQDYASDREILAELPGREEMKNTSVLVIQEAWQPPIMEYIDFVQALRRKLGDNPCIRIGLIGKPQGKTIFTPVNKENLEVWNRTITAIGDPCIYAEGLVDHAA